MKKIALLLAMGVGISSGIQAQPDTQPWWASKWLWAGAAGALFAAGWATWSGYFRKRLHVTCGKDEWQKVQVRPNFAQVSFKKDPVRLVPTFSDVLANNFSLDVKREVRDSNSKFDVFSYALKNTSLLYRDDFFLYICGPLHKEVNSFVFNALGAKTAKPGSVLRAQWGNGETLRTQVKWSDKHTKQPDLEASLMIQGQQLYRFKDKKDRVSKKDLMLLSEKFSSSAQSVTHIIIAYSDDVEVSSDVLEYIVDGSLRRAFKRVESVIIGPLYQGFYFYNTLLNGTNQKTKKTAFPAAVFISRN